jgi:hypothetical protein
MRVYTVIACADGTHEHFMPPPVPAVHDSDDIILPFGIVGPALPLSSRARVLPQSVEHPMTARQNATLIRPCLRETGVPTQTAMLADARQ